MKKKGEKLTKNNNKEKTSETLKTQRKQKGFRLTSATLIIRKEKTKTERFPTNVRNLKKTKRKQKGFRQTSETLIKNKE